ncbi:hypothetical protein EOL96_08310 [Candidatus Saccharibacteria bacterium]|nr:hypothetical protein [Candidatus Saccharibacteria bacterium]
MKRLKIAIDVDDVLADYATAFVDYSNKTWGTNLTVNDYDEHWAKVWGVDNDEVKKRAQHYHKDHIIAQYAHDETALPVLNRLKRRHELIIVTSRRSQVRKATIDWIHYHYPGVFNDDVFYFTSIWDQVNDASVHKTKGDIVRDLGATHIIDDQIKHCFAAAEQGVKALLFGDYGWNQSPELPFGVTRCIDWSEVERYFDDAK